LPRQLGKLAGTSRRTTTHQAGHDIAKEGEGALALHIILDGTAGVSVHGNPTISLIDGKKRSASMTATSDCTGSRCHTGRSTSGWRASPASRWVC
jgi:hypothetical protein